MKLELRELLAIGVVVVVRYPYVFVSTPLTDFASCATVEFSLCIARTCTCKKSRHRIVVLNVGFFFVYWGGQRTVVAVL